jgi:hypothetical protein
VSESSGCLDVSDATSKYSLSGTHFNMNKFGRPTEEDFETVAEVVKGMICLSQEGSSAGRSMNQGSAFGCNALYSGFHGQTTCNLSGNSAAKRRCNEACSVQILKRPRSMPYPDSNRGILKYPKGNHCDHNGDNDDEVETSPDVSEVSSPGDVEEDSEAEGEGDSMGDGGEDSEEDSEEGSEEDSEEGSEEDSEEDGF